MSRLVKRLFKRNNDGFVVKDNTLHAVHIADFNRISVFQTVPFRSQCSKQAFGKLI